MFGKNIRAVATYLSVVQCLPYERLQSLFETMFNVRISQGTLANIVREMLDKSRPAIDLIERLIRNPPWSVLMSRVAMSTADSTGRG